MGKFAEASAENLPWGFLKTSGSTSFSEVPSDHPPVGFLKVAASVVSAAFTAAVRNSELSVSSVASAAFAAALRASACCSQGQRREGPGHRTEFVQSRIIKEKQRYLYISVL